MKQSLALLFALFLMKTASAEKIALPMLRSSPSHLAGAPHPGDAMHVDPKLKVGGDETKQMSGHRFPWSKFMEKS